MSTPGPIEGFSRSIAVLVAIDNYVGGIPVLQTPVADAEKLAGILHRDHGFETEVVTNADATFTKLNQLLGDLKSRVGSNDRVLFYFAGHGIALEGDGGPEGYLLPQDADRKSTRRYLPMADLNRALSALPCRHMLVILDCCFAGAFRWSNTRDVVIAADNLNKKRYAWFIRDAAWQAIASAAHNQKALDVAADQPLGMRDQAARHSPFAIALFDGLAGAADLCRTGQTEGDGVITATELFLYLEERLMPEPDSNQFRQTPLLWPLQNHDKGQFVFLIPGKDLNLPDAPPLANPWMGLRTYDAAQTDLFYGRRRVREALVERVLRDPLVVVTGASGSGKSSLVRAGALRRLEANGITPIVLRPGATPFASLASALRGLGPAPVDAPTEHELINNRGTLLNWITAQNDDRQFLLVIDQAEELITQSRDTTIGLSFLGLLADTLGQIKQRPAKPNRFTEAEARNAIDALGCDKVVDLVEDDNGFWQATAVKDSKSVRFVLNFPEWPIRIVFTIRSEFEPQFAQSAFKSRWSAARFLVPRMTQDELRRVIEGPASVMAIRLESAKLIDDLVNEVVEMPVALPLLSFALSEMYENFAKRRGDDRTLTQGDFDAIEGGVTGSLRSRANQIIDDLDAASQDTARRLLERFVSIEAGAFARRRVPKDELIAAEPSEDARTKDILQRLVNARLIVTDEADNEPFLELAHDALILGWDRLLGWLREDAGRTSALRLLTVDAENSSSHAPGKSVPLWSDAARLAKVNELIASPFPGLNKREKAFAEASIEQAKRQKTFRTVVTATLASLAALATVAASFWLVGAAGNDIDRLLSSARMLQASENTPGMYAFALAAQEKANALPFIWEERRIAATMLLSKGINEGVPIVYDAFSTVHCLDVSKDGTRVAVIGRLPSDTTAQTLSIGPPDKLNQITKNGLYYALAFRPHHPELAVGEISETQMRVHLLDSATGSVNSSFLIAPSEQDGRVRNLYKPVTIDDMKFSTDGERLILAGWASLDPKAVLRYPWRAYVRLSDGSVTQHVATGDMIVDLPAGVQQRIATSDDGSRVASAGISAIFLDDSATSSRSTVGAHSGGVESVSISPSGKQIVASGGRNTLTLVRNETDDKWEQYQIDLPGTEDAKLVQFVSEEMVAVTREDNSISIVRMRSENEAKPRISSSMHPPWVDPPNTRVRATAPERRIASDIHTLRGHSQTIRTIIVDRTHDRLISAGDDRVIRVWGLRSGERQTLRGHERRVNRLNASDSGKWLFSHGIDGKIMVWNLSTPAYRSTRAASKPFEEPISGDDYDGLGDGGGLRAFVNRQEQGFVQHLEASSDGSLFAAGYYGGPIAIWKQDGTFLRDLDTDDGKFKFSKDSRYLIGSKQIWDLNGNFTRTFSNTAPAINGSGQWASIEQEKLKLQPLSAIQPEATEDKSNGAARERYAFFNQDGSLFVTLKDDRYCVWKAPFTSKGGCGQSQWSFANDNVIFRSDEQRFLTLAQSSNGYRLIEVDPPQARARVYRTGELALAFAASHDRKLVAAAGRFGELYFGSIDEDILRDIGKQSRQIRTIAFSADGKWLATGSVDRTVRIWSTATFEYVQLEFLNPIESVVFSGKDRLLVASGTSVRSIAVPSIDQEDWASAVRGASNVRMRASGSIALITTQPVSPAFP